MTPSPSSGADATSVRGLADVLGHPRGAVGVVRVLERHGFGTVEPGQLLVTAADGTHAGSVLRGATDADAVGLAREAIRGPAVLDVDVTEPAATAAGLACAGGARLLGHPLDAGAAAILADAFTTGAPAALISTADGSAVLALAGPSLDASTGSLGSAERNAAAADHARSLLRRGATATEHLTLADADLLVDLWVPVPTILTVGGGALGEALRAQADVLGWGYRRVDTLADASALVAAFTDADVLILIDHDPAFDALLRLGLGHGGSSSGPGCRGFIGALGSRRTQTARRERLLAAGVTEAELAHIHAPVGLDLGARTPAESAVSIVAEVLAARSGRAPAALGVGSGPIGA